MSKRREEKKIGIGKSQSRTGHLLLASLLPGLRSERLLSIAQLQSSSFIFHSLKLWRAPSFSLLGSLSPALKKNPRGFQSSLGEELDLGMGPGFWLAVPEGFTYCAEDGKEGKTKQNKKGENNNRT